MRGRGRIGIAGPLGALAFTTLLLAAGCSDSLVDHAAGSAVLHPGTCGPGQVECGGACVAEDAAHCGAACASCAAPSDPNAAPVCTEAHVCAFACNPGWLRVGAACERAVAVSAGFEHTCAITTDGTLKCWGANEHGQLGDGTMQDSAVPVDVALPAPAEAIAGGYVHTCAIAAGGAYCWGDNTTGALGDGTTTLRSAPVPVPGISGATAVSAGGGEDVGTVPTWYGHSCVLSTGSLWCWGSNESGQLGDGTFNAATSPVQVLLNGSLAGHATAIENGDRHTCAIVAGGVSCWGAAGSWQLGNGNTTNQTQPQQALGSQTVPSALATGAAHTCAVVTSPAPALDCWGSNSAGQAANGDNSALTVQNPAPVSIPGVTPSGVSAGNAHTCVIDGPSGAVTCFGANDVSQLSGPATARGSVTVPLSRPARAVTAGYDHTCALLDDGGIECWGSNGRGQVGTGAVSASVPTPSPVSGR